MFFLVRGAGWCGACGRRNVSHAIHHREMITGIVSEGITIEPCHFDSLHGLFPHIRDGIVESALGDLVVSGSVVTGEARF